MQVSVCTESGARMAGCEKKFIYKDLGKAIHSSIGVVRVPCLIFIIDDNELDIID